MKKPLLTLILLCLAAAAICQESGNQYTLSITESFFANPDDILPLLQNALNANDVLKFVSYCPLKQDMEMIGFSDMVLRIMVFDKYNIYMPGLEGALLNRIIANYSSYYTQVKLNILYFYMPETANIIRVKERSEAENLKEQIAKIMNKQIKIDLIKKMVYDRGSLYRYTEAFLYVCRLSCENQVLTEQMIVRVEKIDGQWRVVFISF